MANSSVVGWLRTILTMDTAAYEAGGRKAVSTNEAMKRSVDGLGKEVGKITPQAERMVKAFGGDKLLYSANSLTQAITKLGGATKLSEVEQARANKTLTDAIGKYTSLGQKAPQAMVDLERATRRSTSVTDLLSTSIGKVGAVLGVSFGTAAVVGFARSLGEFAGEMKGMSVETGIGVERLQALNYVGTGVNLTIQSITGAATMLAERLGSGDKSAIAALSRMGIAAEDLKGQRLDEVLFRIGDGARRITDQNERIALFRDLFGKSGSQMLRLFEDDLRQVVGQAENSGAVISKELIDKADEFSSRWDQALIRFKASSVIAFDFVFTNPAKQIDNFGKQWARMLDELAQKAGRPSIFSGQGITAPAVSDTELKAILAQSEALMKAAIAAEAYQAAVRKIYEDIGGATAARSVQQLAAAWGLLSPAQRANSAIVADVLKRYEALRAEVGTNLVPALETLFVTTGTLTNKTMALRDAIGMLPPVVEAAADSIEGHLLPSAQGFDALFEAAKRTREAHDELVRLGMIAPQITEENERVSESVTKQARAWTHLADRLRGVGAQLSDAAIGNLGSLLFGFGDDTRELKRTAEEAEQEYLRIKRSGKATAEELTLAFRRFHEAEERANHGFAERFKDVWQGIKTSLQNVLNELLQFFVEKFLVGLATGIAGKRLGTALAGVFNGGGPAAPSAAPDAAAAGATGNAFAQSNAGTRSELQKTADFARQSYESIRDNCFSTTKEIEDAWEKAEAAKRTASRQTGAITRLEVLGIAAASLQSLALVGAKSKSLAILAKAGAIGAAIINTYEGATKALAKLPPPWNFAASAAVIASGLAQVAIIRKTPVGYKEGTRRLDFQNFGARTPTELHGEEAVIPRGGGHRLGMEIADSLRRLSVQPMRSFAAGGFVPPGVTQPAMLHGGANGELVVPASQMKSGGDITIVNQNHWNLSAMDGESLARVIESPEFTNRVARVFELNANFLTTRVQRALA